MKLLLLDDEAFLRKATARALERDDVTILTFAKPADCDAYLAEHGWNDVRWIVSDNRMPGEFGTAWFLRRRAEIEALEIHFVLVTGDDNFQWKHTAWLSKPYDRMALRLVVYDE